MSDLQKIKDRIAKLLAMAKDASSPNEAAIAAARARKLMDKHQVSESECEAGFVEEFSELQATRFFAAIPLYISFFATAIAKYNDCQAVFNWGVVDFKKKPGDKKKMGKAICFRGYKSDVELCEQMFKSIEDAVNRLCREYMEGLGLPKYNVRLGGLFKHGAIDQISARLRAMTKEREALACGSTGTSLVLAKQKAVEERFGGVKYRSKSMPTVSAMDDALAMRAGFEAGNKIEIIKSLED